MVGVHNYDILSNEQYAHKYLYTPVRMPKRHRYVISPYDMKMKDLRKSSLDVVRIVCDMAYLPENRARHMVFTPEYLYLERKRLNAIEKEFSGQEGIKLTSY